MYKCIKVREIESALCCLPSVPGQCNELASISKGDLKQKKQKKNYDGFRPFESTKTQKRKTNNQTNKKKSNVQQCHHHRRHQNIIFQIIRSKEKKIRSRFFHTEADKTVLCLMPSAVQQVPMLSQSQARPVTTATHQTRRHSLPETDEAASYFLGFSFYFYFF